MPDQNVAVVVTTHNHARFLGDALASVMAQTVRPGEVVVVDDGSEDRPEDVVLRFPGVRLVRQSNKGLAAARNTGWQAVESEFVTFLDADDMLRRHNLEINREVFSKSPESAFVYGAYRKADARGRPIVDVPPTPVGEDAYASFLAGNKVGMHATVLFRRSCIAEVGGYDTSLPVCEDYDMYLRLAQRWPVKSHSYVVADYRQHGENMSRNLPLMLETALRVQERHRGEAQRKPERLRAYREGRREWQDYYVRLQLQRTRDGLSERGPRALISRSLIKIAAKAPTTMFRLLFGKARSAMQQHVSRPGVDFGALRRTTPISRTFGSDRGKPVDRHYVERFLAENSGFIRGRVLEIGDDSYTRQFGGDRVEHRDVLNVQADAPGTTIVGDLNADDPLPHGVFDCIVFTQTLHLLYDMPKTLATLYQSLKPGGTLLVTVPGVSSVDHGGWSDTWYWSLTSTALDRLLNDAFPGGSVATRVHGNVLVATAFLYGLAEHELAAEEFDATDPHFPVIVAARATKAV